MAWYADSIREYPEGLVTQAQAAKMLNIGRMDVARLIMRGYLQAVYFPKPPGVVGVAVGQDDPTWIKIVGWFNNALGDKADVYFPKACYVSFGDVRELWESGEARKKCERDWSEVMVTFRPNNPKAKEAYRENVVSHRKAANKERASKERRK